MSKRRTKAADPNPQHIKQSILNRVGWLYVIFFVLGVAITAQIIVIQFGPNGEPLSNLSESKCFRVETIASSRGNILAHDGQILSTDAPYYNIRLDMAIRDIRNNLMVKDSLFDADLPALADSLSKVLGEPPIYYERRLREIRNRAKSGGPGSRDQLLVSRINQIELDRIKTFPIFREPQSGFMARKDTLRYKPYGTLASYTIGRPGAYGLEHYYDEVLTGEDGRNLTVRLVGNTRLPVLDTINREARNGYDVVTTIDVDLQDVAENALREQLSDKQALFGTAVVMEVATGEIRAIANLTHNSDGTITDNFNYAILSRGEPGSTFKLVALMALLEQGGMTINDIVDCGNGFAVVHRAEVNDSHPVGKVTVKEMMEQSSNIGFARCIEKVYREDETRFTDFIEAIGIDRPADIQLQKGINAYIKDPRLGVRNDWNAQTLTKMAYGYALELSPMHILMLYNAVACGGKLLSPILVKELRDGDHVVERYQTEVLNPQICSPETLADLRLCLEGVVANGTASILQNENYRVAGKTGTAQVAQPHGGYYTLDGGRDYLATLVGYFPAEAPKYSCIVVIKTHNAPGSTNIYYGGSLAGPVFKAITDRIYALDNEWRERVVPTAPSGPVEVKLGPESAMQRAQSGIGVTMRADYIAPQQEVEEQEISEEELYAHNWRVMPSVMGMGLSDALYTLERSGLSVEFSGKGEVIEQHPSPTALYLEGDRATIRLGMRENNQETTLKR